MNLLLVNCATHHKAKNRGRKTLVYYFVVYTCLLLTNQFALMAEHFTWFLNSGEGGSFYFRSVKASRACILPSVGKLLISMHWKQF